MIRRWWKARKEALDQLIEMNRLCQKYMNKDADRLIGEEWKPTFLSHQSDVVSI